MLKSDIDLIIKNSYKNYSNLKIDTQSQSAKGVVPQSYLRQTEHLCRIERKCCCGHSFRQTPDLLQSNGLKEAVGKWICVAHLDYV